MPTYYDILGVEQKASVQEIKTAYRELIKRYHPDKNPNQAEALKRTQIINDAYSVLKDPIKRSEYDNLLLLQNSSKLTEEYAHETEATQPEIPQIRCEKCGRQDVTLRVTIFIRVLSVILMTYKRGWSHILCSRCRIKYSLLFNLENWLLGWWGFPWGPIYTVEALLKNLAGGVQPLKNNADLFELLSYNFYQQNRHAEAYKVLLKSHIIKSSKKKEEFLNYLSHCSSNKISLSFADRILSRSPAWFNVPLLAFLSLISSIFIRLLTGNNNGEISTQYASSYLTHIEKANTPKRGFDSIAKTIGINTDDIDNSIKISKQAIKSVASHIKSNVPMSGKKYEANKIIYNYEFDRSKLNELLIDKYAETIRTETSKVFNIVKSSSPSIEASLAERKEESEKLKIYLKQQLDFLASALFNVYILEVSIDFIKQFNKGFVSNKTMENIKQIGQDPLLKNWLTKSKQGDHYFKLLASLEQFDSYQKILLNLDKKTKLLETIINDEKNKLSNIKERLNYYESINSYEEYNSLIPQYNSLLNSIQDNINKYNSSVSKYNELVANLTINYLDSAFNDCLDSDVLFTEFEKVNFNIMR